MNSDVAVTHGGPKTSLRVTPPRVVGSIRRTTTIDSVRPDGLDGDVVVVARGRDLHTTASGAVQLSADAFEAVVSAERYLRELVHPDPRLAALVGHPVASGFRARVLELLPDEARSATLLNLLLDDLPGANLVAGYAMQRDPSWSTRPMPVEHLSALTDLCAGWASGATMVEFIARDGSVPVPTAAPTRDEASDLDAWHDRPVLPAGSMRRARRIDVVADDRERATVRFDVHFRDSYMAGSDEGAVHEYSLRGRVDLATNTVAAIDAEALVLPWQECPAALASVGRVLGTTVDDLRARIRTTFVGTGTCTHLNDTLRGLADVPTLGSALLDPDS